MNPPEFRYCAFVVRVWQSARPEDTAAVGRAEADRAAQDWLAQVEMLASGAKFYFGSPQGLLEYLQEVIGIGEE